jgi:hypothetical protein
VQLPAHHDHHGTSGGMCRRLDAHNGTPQVVAARAHGTPARQEGAEQVEQHKVDNVQGCVINKGGGGLVTMQYS